MSRMCRPIFGSGKAVVLDSRLCVARGIIELKAKGLCVSDLIKKQHYWLKGVDVDLIFNNFDYKGVGDVVIIEAISKYNKLFKIFCMK